MDIKLPSFSLAKLSSWVGAIGVIVGAVFAFDARYNTKPVIDSLKAEIVNEIAVNRSAMISIMQREADDIEFEMITLQAAGEQVPRYLIDKHKQLERDIEKLKKDENIAEGSSS